MQDTARFVRAARLARPRTPVWKTSRSLAAERNERGAVRAAAELSSQSVESCWCEKENQARLKRNQGNHPAFLSCCKRYQASETSYLIRHADCLVPFAAPFGVHAVVYADLLASYCRDSPSVHVAICIDRKTRASKMPRTIYMQRSNEQNKTPVKFCIQH